MVTEVRAATAGSSELLGVGEQCARHGRTWMRVCCSGLGLGYDGGFNDLVSELRHGDWFLGSDENSGLSNQFVVL